MGERASGKWHHHEACKVSLNTIVERGPSSLNCACWPRRGAFLTEHPENANLLCKVQNRIWGGLYLSTLSQSSWVQPTATPFQWCRLFQKFLSREPIDVKWPSMLLGEDPGTGGHRGFMEQWLELRVPYSCVFPSPHAFSPCMWLPHTFVASLYI